MKSTAKRPRRFVAFATMGLLTACVSHAPEVPVVVTDDVRATGGCSYIGLVSSVKDAGDVEAVRQMKAEVFDRGGDTLLLSYGTGSQGLAIHGEAYRCGRRRPAPPPPQ